VSGHHSFLFSFFFFARAVLGLDFFIFVQLISERSLELSTGSVFKKIFESDQSVCIMPDHLHYRDLPPACCFKTMLRFGGGQVF
jgi:hypothetical protein